MLVCLPACLRPYVALVVSVHSPLCLTTVSAISLTTISNLFLYIVIIIIIISSSSRHLSKQTQHFRTVDNYLPQACTICIYRQQREREREKVSFRETACFRGIQFLPQPAGFHSDCHQAASVYVESRRACLDV